MVSGMRGAPDIDEIQDLLFHLTLQCRVAHSQPVPLALERRTNSNSFLYKRWAAIHSPRDHHAGSLDASWEATLQSHLQKGTLVCLGLRISNPSIIIFLTPSSIFIKSKRIDGCSNHPILGPLATNVAEAVRPSYGSSTSTTRVRCVRRGSHEQIVFA